MTDLPWSLEVEQAVLGAMLLDPDAAMAMVTGLDEPVFYRDAHRAIFRAMRGCIERNVVIDHLTLREALERAGQWEAAGGDAYTAELMDAAVTSANVQAHAAILREKALLRSLIALGHQTVAAGHSGTPAKEVLDATEAAVFRLADDRPEQEFVRAKTTLWPVMAHIEHLAQRGEDCTGVPSGFTALDRMTAGFQPGDLVIVAARPSMGKTAFAMQVGEHAAEQGAGCGIFSMEMSREALIQRMLCGRAKVDANAVRRGRLADWDFTALSKAAGEISTMPLWIDDSPALTILDMRARARRLKKDHGAGVLIVDYLQLMRSPRFASDRVQEVSDISRSLKGLARELHVPILALSQLSRASEQRGGERKPILSDLRDSGAIEQDADVVIFLHRPEMYEPVAKDGTSNAGRAELIVAKHRNGPTGHLDLTFEHKYTRFAEVVK